MSIDLKSLLSSQWITCFTDEFRRICQPTSVVQMCSWQRMTLKGVCFPDGDYMETIIWDYTELIIIAVSTGVLFAFSVVGSVYVFIGHWRKQISECGNSGKKQMQKREEKKEGKLEEDHVDVITDPSTSFYASLEPRPRSIYDVLDNSAANREPDQSKTAIKTNETPKMTVQTTQQQDEGVFECVYENF
ncbi:hypothetical protein PAMP_020970 [Pampus punctatissimus]